MKFHLAVVLNALLFTVLFCPSAAQAVSTFFTVGGYLEDSGGNPVNSPGALPLRIVYYDDATTTTATATFDTTTFQGIKNGVFTAQASIPDPLLGQPTLWYEMAIDTDSDGFDAADFFAERFQVNIIDVGEPLLPTEQFNTGIGETEGTVRYETDTVVIVPFQTPSGGVHFNRILTNAIIQNSLINFAIYDTSGDMVAQTGPTLITNGLSGPSQANPVLPASGMLDGNTIYYIATATTYPQNFYYRTNGMFWPYKSYLVSSSYSSLKLTTANAFLPQHIDQIELRIDNRPFEVGLWYVPDSKSGSLIPKGKSK